MIRNIPVLLCKMIPLCETFEVSSQWRAIVKTQAVIKSQRPRILEVTDTETIEFKVREERWYRT